MENDECAKAMEQQSRLAAQMYAKKQKQPLVKAGKTGKIYDSASQELRKYQKAAHQGS